MKFVHVSRRVLAPEHLARLMISEAAAPKIYRRSSKFLAQQLFESNMLLFEIEGTKGLILVSIEVNEGVRQLSIEGMYFPGGFMRYSALIKQVCKLARHWDCDEIETTVFTPRLAEAMKLIGATARATTFTMEANYGQQENQQDD